jgi:hypothetical protein
VLDAPWPCCAPPPAPARKRPGLAAMWPMAAALRRTGPLPALQRTPATVPPHTPLARAPGAACAIQAAPRRPPRPPGRPPCGRPAGAPAGRRPPHCPHRQHRGRAQGAGGRAHGCRGRAHGCRGRAHGAGGRAHGAGGRVGRPGGSALTRTTSQPSLRTALPAAQPDGPDKPGQTLSRVGRAANRLVRPVGGPKRRA